MIRKLVRPCLDSLKPESSNGGGRRRRIAVADPPPGPNWLWAGGRWPAQWADVNRSRRFLA